MGRTLALVALILLTGACWTPGPGQVDPTRYPWDRRNAKASYCIVSLETSSTTGITMGGQNAVNSACEVLPNASGRIGERGDRT